MKEDRSDLWDDWSPEPPAPLPRDFAGMTARLATAAKNNLRAMRTFQVGSCLAVVLAGLIAWTLSRYDHTPDAPPALSLFHSSGSPRVFDQP